MTLPAFGLTMNHSIPARLEAGLPTVTAVSRAPQTLPFAYITCCMRVSLESGRETTSLGLGAPTSNAQQPMKPLNSVVVVSVRQWPCGTSTPGAVPEPGCLCFGGMPYFPTSSTLLVRLSDGDALSSDD